MREGRRFVRWHNTRRPRIERFWGKVEKPPGDGCWLWTGFKDRGGYGRINVGGRMVLAHRVAWELASGRPVPPGLKVLHNCPGGDNPGCVNPAHLWVDTQAKNVEDMVAKGRQARGERNAGARLATEQIVEIRRRRSDGETQASLAHRFSVGKTTIQNILSGRRWAWLKAS